VKPGGGGTATGSGVVVVRGCGFRCGFGGMSRVLRDWTDILLWLVAGVVFLFLSVSVFLPAIH